MKSCPASAQEASVAEPSITAMRLRVYPGEDQAGRLAQWLYIRHHFRNHAVSFLQERRKARARWIHNHPVLFKIDGVDASLAGNDADACSRWLTERLEATRKAVIREFGLTGGKAVLSSELAKAWVQLSRGEQKEVIERHAALGRHVLWLLLPRTILDQVVQDLKKTLGKALKDRAENKKRKAKGQRPIRPAGFPTHQKWTFATSLRLQVVASKNQAFREGWEAGELVIPGLGRLRVREHGYAWPATPPSLITLSRTAGNTWHVTFTCVQGEARSARRRRLDRERRDWEALPLDDQGRPAIEALDMSLAHKAVSNVHGKMGRNRYLKTCASKLKFRNRQVARRKKGSGRWKKSVQKLGKLHDKVKNQRAHENRAKARAVANRSAIVCVETLKTQFMFKNSHLAQSIADLGWGQFLRELEQAMAARGHLLLFAGQFDPTTQTCPGCGVKNPALKGAEALKIRAWDCPGCQLHHDRDHAAADNIQDFAIERFLESYSGTGGERLPGIGQLHPELVRFISRGGMTAFRRETARESRQALLGLGCAVPGKRGKPGRPNDLSGTGERAVRE